MYFVRLAILVSLGVFLFTAHASADFLHYNGFASTGGLVLGGGATVEAGGTPLQLATAHGTTNQWFGSVSFAARQDVSAFSSDFVFRLADMSGGGADSEYVAFV